MSFGVAEPHLRRQLNAEEKRSSLFSEFVSFGAAKPHLRRQLNTEEK